MFESRCRSLAFRALAATAAALSAATLAVPALGVVGSGSGAPTTSLRSLLSSKELWATIDVCDSPHHPNTVGVRGSMPGDGNTHDKMYMSFRLQYLNATSDVWVNLPTSSAPTFVSVGAGASARQGGTSFQLVPVAGKPGVRMRGVVAFQWRRGKKVLQSTSRPTTPKHKSLAGAEPKGYSSATCLIG